MSSRADADAHDPGRQFVEVDEGAVPGDEAQVAVEHRDALAGVVERVLQEVAAVLQGRGSIIEEAQRVPARHVAAAQQERQRETRGGGADRRSEQVLGVAQEVDVGLRPLSQIKPRVRAKLSKERVVRSSPR
jgi:hypothetical protein